MIDGKPFQLSVMRNAAVGTNAVNKLNALIVLVNLRRVSQWFAIPELYDRVVHLYSQRSD